jgi:hypothetical protein
MWELIEHMLPQTILFAFGAMTAFVAVGRSILFACTRYEEWQQLKQSRVMDDDVQARQQKRKASEQVKP